MKDNLKDNLSEFVVWCQDYLSGSERSDAQIFLNRLFIAFGHDGLREAGAVLEQRIHKEKGRTGFADLVWRPIVLIEMKARGENLSKHFRQAFDYWVRLVPGRPRYVILCNFNEFWIYDFETQMDAPVDIVHINDIPARHSALSFLLPSPQVPVFRNNKEEVTRHAAQCLANCFNSLTKRGIESDLSRRFVLQSLVALFSEDIGLLAPDTFTRVVHDCKKPSDSFDLIGGLFSEMNSPGVTKGGRFNGVPYFNGGVFSSPARVELINQEIGFLKEACQFKWQNVSPEIFGSIFEFSLGKSERSAFGAYFTSANDIMKIVGPTIVDPWSEEIKSANSLKKLRVLLLRLQSFKVLDPACGSGNFLYIAYREIKRLEARIYDRMAKEYKSVDPAQRPFGFVTARNFYGIDYNQFAVDLAKVTMMIGRKLSIDELHITENALPLDNLDDNIIAGDALLYDDGEPRDWPNVDVVIGNPPFLGAKKIKQGRTPAYVKVLRAAYPEVSGMADYCVYWIRKTHDALPDCKVNNPVSGRAGLVGTQNIRNTQSRKDGLDYVVKTGAIVEAVENQPWSGDANVNVSIVNWIKTNDPLIIPSKKILWSKIDNPASSAKQRQGKIKPKFEMERRFCTFINSSLSDKVDVSTAEPLVCNTVPQRVFQGITPGHEGFVLSQDDVNAILAKTKNGKDVIHPYLIGREVVTGDGRPQRYVIDFQPYSLAKASTYGAAFARVQKLVLPDRRQKAEEGQDADGNMRPHHRQFLEWWWRLSWERGEMVKQIEKLGTRYIVCSRVTKRPIFCFVHKSIRPGDRLQNFMFSDDYSFGILQSNVHWVWFITKCPKQTERFIYTSEDVFDTFPWPQNPSKQQIDAIAVAARKVREARDEAMEGFSGGLRGLYKLLIDEKGKNDLKTAHRILDEAVMDAYSITLKEDILESLLNLNINVRNRISEGKSVTPPGIPKSYPQPAKLLTEDSVMPLDAVKLNR